MPTETIGIIRFNDLLHPKVSPGPVVVREGGQKFHNLEILVRIIEPCIVKTTGVC
jgi:hypothetical protein